MFTSKPANGRISQRDIKKSVFSVGNNNDRTRSERFMRIPHAPNTMKRGRDEFFSREDARSSDSEDFSIHENHFLNGGGITHGHALVLDSFPLSSPSSQSFAAFSYHFGAWDHLPDFDLISEASSRSDTSRKSGFGSPSASLSSSLRSLNIYGAEYGVDDWASDKSYLSSEKSSMLGTDEAPASSPIGMHSAFHGDHEFQFGGTSHSMKMTDENLNASLWPAMPSNIQLVPPPGAIFSPPIRTFAQKVGSPTKVMQVSTQEDLLKNNVKKLGSMKHWPVLTPTTIPNASEEEPQKKRRFMPSSPRSSSVSSLKHQLSPCLNKEKRRGLLAKGLRMKKGGAKKIRTA
ncbi:hypothetical protein L228DRAFT_239170 [Xylona heveae TC161]|uniref:Uncharacterized protein n=1 Tax=Xylona heveae (strain CBS 132557 / TC161) TaxID=1328760 RepID=A0A165GGP9_XYLHT|nr:hypothetical protein L228DRAFT_239170 [Xylona heveae TC161]KZF22165.1 hypothetical protein L228DRAFT_239170 [Xylona heveae TC161]